MVYLKHSSSFCRDGFVARHLLIKIMPNENLESFKQVQTQNRTHVVNYNPQIPKLKMLRPHQNGCITQWLRWSCSCIKICSTKLVALKIYFIYNIDANLNKCLKILTRLSSLTGKTIRTITQTLLAPLASFSKTYNDSCLTPLLFI